MNKAILFLFLILLGGCFVPSSAQSLSFEQTMKNLGIIKSDVVDMSDSAKIKIATPNCAYINITGVDKMPWSKTAKASIDMHANAEIYDAQGHYFKKKVLLNAQGQSSMGFNKKNFALDFCEDEWIGDKTTSITFGDWVSQSAFHFKAYYLDKFRGTASVGYKLYSQLVADHDSYLVRAGFEDNGARCYPDGFPCIVYLNDEFYGVFAWNLKKDRKNMNLTKDDANHIHLDGKMGSAQLWKGEIDWTAFEVRNPKTLYTVDTEKVDGFTYKKVSDEDLISSLEGTCEIVTEKPSDWTNIDISDRYGNEPPQYLYYEKKSNYYELKMLKGDAYIKYNGDKPIELIDESMPLFDAKDKGHILTAQVKHNVEKLSQYYNELKALENSGASKDEIRLAFEERFDIVSLIDYMVFSCVINHYDGFAKNWQWVTWDGTKWYVAPYDLDATFGNYHTGTVLLPADWRTAGSKFTSFKYYTTGPCYFVTTYYYDRIAERYSELRDNGVLTVDNIMSHFREWNAAVGETNYNNEWNKWSSSPCIQKTTASPGWTTEDDWLGFSKVPVYDDSVTYKAGDRCTYQTRIWTATSTITGVPPCSNIGYSDDLDRVETWVSERLALADMYATYTEDKFLTSYTMNISAAQWGTICVPFSFGIPEGVELYRITGVDEDGEFVKKEVANYIEAHKPYLVHAAPGMYLLKGKKEEEPSEADALKDGLLIGTYEDIKVPKDDFVLQNQNGILAFYHVAHEGEIKLYSNRAYLSLPSSDTTANIKMIRITDDAVTTAVEKIASESKDRIVSIHTISGSSVSVMQKGLNIVRYADGRTEKILMK